MPVPVAWANKSTAISLQDSNERSQLNPLFNIVDAALSPQTRAYIVFPASSTCDLYKQAGPAVLYSTTSI